MAERNGKADTMSSQDQEVSQTIRHLRKKLIKIFEEDVDGLCDELDVLHLLSLEEYVDLQYEEDPRVRTEKMMDIIIHKGEAASKKFFHHLQNMTLRFPALSSLPHHHLLDGKKTPFQELVEQLGMKNHLTSKVALSDILSIGAESLTEDQPDNIKDISWYFLRNLMALKRISRNTQLKKKSATPVNIDVFDVFEAELDTSNTVHPLDVLCVLLHCSDSFLQQEIVTKMAMCQYAVPLLLPPANDGSHCTLMLWAMRDIVKKWRPQSLVDSRGFKENNIANILLPIFSFVKLGNSKMSKSKILNQILNPAQQHHNFFIHHDMEGGNIKRKISDGLVEMSCYFPCGNSDVFPDPIAVTNLRGDLEDNMEQFRFLTRISSALFIFIESISERQFKLLSTLKNTDTRYYLIISPGKKISSQIQTFLKHLMETIHLSADQIIVKRNNSNDAEFVEKIQDLLGGLLRKQPPKLSLENMKKQTHGLQIDVDENFPECQKARACACNITSMITDVEAFKKEMLKLQGDLWRQLSKVEKELCRMTKQGEMGTEEYRSHLKEQRVALHKEQNQHDLTDAMMLFISAITNLSQIEKQYFLKWMKLELDLIARRNLSSLQVEYKEKSRSDNPEDLKQVDQKISDSSLGIEHFLRELGQFYEAECSMVKEGMISGERIQFTGLPGIAADLLLDGFPLELIDGDASNIPMKWITDVLTELNAKTGGKSKIRVITVLGVQSTGKSTLLNTMFGLQFPVASGRCTRGAFMTLLKVKDDFQEELGCPFLLVIDTEGLKAPELASLDDSYEHDNELATLVVGLSDITIVNMAMENTSEMKDILQIVVHAFLRMKEIGKKPNCQFVHQNVSDVSAHEKNMRDRRKLLEQLDEMTKAAAKMENKAGITSFNDVLDYDLDTHSWYIPGLWQGVPPMAPVNSGYSENVNKLKKYLFEFMKSQKALCTIGEFITWIESLWRAVKHEKFIFSFRNSLVADAYNKLSMQFSLWEWEFSKKVHNFVISTENNIKNQVAESLDTETFEEYRRELQLLVSEEESKMLDLLEKYYDRKSENVHLIERYREDFRLSVQFLRKDQEMKALTKCSEAVSIQKGKFQIQKIQNEYQRLIEEKINDLLKNSGKNFELKDEELQQEFESMWEEILRDLQIKKLVRRNVNDNIMQQLRHDLRHKGSDVHVKLKHHKNLASYGQCTFTMDKKYIDRSWWNRLKDKCGLKNETSEHINTFALQLIDKCKMYVKETTETSEDYDNTHCQELLHKIDAELKSSKLPFSENFELEIKLLILGHAAEIFQKMHDTFIKNNDPRASLESLKPYYLTTFLSIFKKKDLSQNKARQFCEQCLKPAITDYVFKHLGEKIVDDILNSSEKIIFSSRSFFQFNILEKLLEEMSFKKYAEYIDSYEKFSKSWIFKYVCDKYKSSTTLGVLCKNVLSFIMKKIHTVLKDKVCLESPDVSSFSENVCKKLQNELVISQQEMKVIIFHNTASGEQFSSDIQHFLTEMEQEILTELGSLDIESVLSRVTLKPHYELFRKVVGCGKQCPFCKVPCEAGGGDHREHFASIHRSSGLGGWRSVNSKTLGNKICSTLVVSDRHFRCSLTNGERHPYKEYRTYFPEWAIQPDPSIESSDYWKYVFVKFNQQFAEQYRAKKARLPEEWGTISENQALGSLKKVFNIS